MKTFFLPLLSLIFFFGLIACNSTSPPEESPEIPTEPLAFSASQPNFTTTIVEADLPSPRKEMQGELNSVNVTVNYGSPSTKGRAIWGSLVPYGEVWRTGANEATRITIDKNIVINDKELAAGTYSLFTVPAKDSWEVIFNANSDQWGAYEYSKDKDVLRVKVQPVQRDSVSKTLEFELIPGALQLLWDKLALPISFTGT